MVPSCRNPIRYAQRDWIEDMAQGGAEPGSTFASPMPLSIL